MGALTRAYDWTKTPLGAPASWPQSLKTAIRLLLTSQHPMFIWWGPELIQFYNDAYRETMGPERHPSALGARGRKCWDEIWDIIPAFGRPDSVLKSLRRRDSFLTDWIDSGGRRWARRSFYGRISERMSCVGSRRR